MYAKLTYSLLIAAAAGLTACTSDADGIGSAADGFEVRFIADARSRAVVESGSTVKNTPFAVYGEFVSTEDATATPVQLFKGTQVTYTDGSWKYNNPQYWFPAMTYSFIALHPAADPAGLTNKEYSDNQLSFTYSLPSDYHDATDLLAATHRRRYTSGATTPVAFNLGHILSRLNFAVNISPVAAGAGNSVVIEGFALRSVSTSATYTISPSPITYGDQTEDAAGGWIEHSDPAENAQPLFDLTFDTPILLSAGDRHEFFPITGSEALLAIPQMLTPDVVIELTYHRVLNGIEQPRQIVYGNLYPMAVTAHGGRWTPGQSYTYTFTLGGEEYIIFNPPTVQDWNESEGASYIITD